MPRNTRCLAEVELDKMHRDRVAENRRLRGEVRRLRRVIETPSFAGPYAVCRYCQAGMEAPEGVLVNVSRIKHHPGCIAEAALAPRRRKS